MTDSNFIKFCYMLKDACPFDIVNYDLLGIVNDFLENIDEIFKSNAIKYIIKYKKHPQVNKKLDKILNVGWYYSGNNPMELKEYEVSYKIIRDLHGIYNTLAEAIYDFIIKYEASHKTLIGVINGSATDI